MLGIVAGVTQLAIGHQLAAIIGKAVGAFLARDFLRHGGGVVHLGKERGEV